MNPAHKTSSFRSPIELDSIVNAKQSLYLTKDEFQRASSGVNPASPKESEPHVRTESLL